MTPPASPPERFASAGAPLPFSNPSSGFKLPDNSIPNSANTQFAPKQTEQKKPDPFQISTPPKQSSDSSNIETSPSGMANNSATRLLDQVTDDSPSTRPIPQPLADGFAKPTTKPVAKSFAQPATRSSQPNLTNSQKPPSTANTSAPTNIESFNNRTRPVNETATTPNGILSKPVPSIPGSDLNKKNLIHIFLYWSCKRQILKKKYDVDLDSMDSCRTFLWLREDDKGSDWSTE